MLKQRNRHPVVWLEEELADPHQLSAPSARILAEWKLAYKRGYMMQASLAIVGGLFGLVAFLSTLDWLAAWSRPPARELALHDLHDHADQQAPHGRFAGGRHG